MIASGNQIYNSRINNSAYAAVKRRQKQNESKKEKENYHVSVENFESIFFAESCKEAVQDQEFIDRCVVTNTTQYYEIMNFLLQREKNFNISAMTAQHTRNLCNLKMKLFTVATRVTAAITGPHTPVLPYFCKV